MTTHAEPLRLLCLSPDYLSLVRGNERRDDPVRAAAADDYAEETLDAKGWEAYALTRRMSLPDGETKMSPAVTVDGRRVYAFAAIPGSDAWRVHSVRQRPGCRAKRLACTDLARAALVIALMMDSAAAKALRRKNERAVVKKYEAGFVNPLRVGQKVLGPHDGFDRACVVVKVNAKSAVVERPDGVRVRQKCVNIVKGSGGWDCDLSDCVVLRPRKQAKAS